MIKLTVDEELFVVDLTPWQKYIAWSPGAQYFNLPPGQEHYRLLAYLAGQLPQGSSCADCGTLYGCSAVALAALGYARTVLTFDIKDHLPPGQTPSYLDIATIKPYQLSALDPDAIAEMINCQIIVLDIDPHDGKQETDFLVQLELHSYRGILICDDIHLNEAMEKFWVGVQGCFRERLERAPAYKCIDLTPWGHWSGTGAVVFDPAVIDLEVKL